MVLDIKTTTIEKKQFMGSKELVNVIVPSHVTAIENWAFAHCSNLKTISIPASLEYIGNQVFLNCDKLGKVVVYDENSARIASKAEDYNLSKVIYGSKLINEYLSKLLAIAILKFDYNGNILTEYGSDEWLEKWDTTLCKYIEEADDNGFKPFLAGGEEDYENIDNAREKFCYNRQCEKINAIFSRIRLMQLGRPIKDDARGCYNEYLKSKIDACIAGCLPVIDCLRLSENNMYLLFQFCCDIDLFDSGNVNKYIDYLTDDDVELKAHFMKINSNNNKVWEQFDII